jgi:steroid 5-alpha reductase family enzyme
MESFSTVLLLNLGFSSALMASVWIASLRVRDVSIVDIAWGATGAMMAITTFFMTDGAPARKFLVVGMTVVWGFRLAFHIGLRSRGKGEDFRYAAMRARAPKAFPKRSLVTVFFLQAVLIWAISLPAQVAQFPAVPRGLTLLDFLGLGVWSVGLMMEAVADAQLRKFLSDPANKGRVMNQGLWRYSRHPNYFGDSLIWWGIFLVAAATPGGWITIFSPILMTYFLMRVSGVPMLEEALAERREGYREYMRETSPFVPWPPKSSTG